MLVGFCRLPVAFTPSCASAAVWCKFPQNRGRWYHEISVPVTLQLASGGRLEVMAGQIPSTWAKSPLFLRRNFARSVLGNALLVRIERQDHAFRRGNKAAPDGEEQT